MYGKSMLENNWVFFPTCQYHHSLYGHLYTSDRILFTYKPTSFDKDEILANHRSFMTTSSIPSGKEYEDLPYLYWIPKLHKTPYKERYIAESSTCSTKELSIHLTKILSAVKEGQQKYCEIVYSRSGINHMWILKKTLKIFWITLNQDVSLRYPPLKPLIFQLYIPPYRMPN